jgi:hypothetical protein
MKEILAYIVATYDIKLEEGQSVPQGYYLFGARVAATVNVMFRARRK